MINQTNDDQLWSAAYALLAGELVAIPTETVYGLGADASNPVAVNRIYEVKGRPADHPLIVHVASLSDCYAWVDDATVINRLSMLGNAFWPGPLTVIVPRKNDAPAFASAGQASIGLRVPAHPIATALLLKFHELGGLGIAAPSANRFGKVSPTSAAHVRADLGSDVPWVIDGGECAVGLESTIVDLSTSPPRVLRPGAISALELSQCLDEPVAQGAIHASPQVSGSLASHYAPATPLKLLDAQQIIQYATQAQHRIGIWAQQSTCAGINMSPQVSHNVSTKVSTEVHYHIAKSSAKDYAHELYAVLRRIDTWGVAEVLIELPPMDADSDDGDGSDDGAWTAVLDRLQRASYAA
jgi:L-threonylcarbamoyladenylate synthase